MADVVTLPSPPPPPRAAALAARDVTGDAIGRVLGALASRPGPLPKYRYPSAGTLYPVQAYVSVSGRIGDLAPGSYYYDPDGHALAPLSDASLTPPDATGPPMLLLLMAQHAAISPVYPGEAGTFCMLEAGYIIQAARDEAAACGLTLRDAGDPAGDAASHIRTALRLDASHAPLACLALES